MQQEQESAQLCVNGCGFFGNPASGGMCSVCWKKHMSTHHAETTASTAAAPKPVDQAVPELVATESAVSTTEHAHVDVAVATEAMASSEASLAPAVAEAAVETVETPVQKNKKRCWACMKKVGFTGIECRCGFVFCSNHRYPDQHTCSFDFKAADRAELARRNPGGGEFGKLERL